MLQLTRKGLVLQGQLDVLRDRFATNHYVVLEKLLEPELLETVQRKIGKAPWRSSAYDSFEATEFTLDDDAVGVHLLLFLLNTPEFLNAIRIVSGCTQISDFVGRVYRMTPGSRHHLSWHDDHIKPRQLGFSMNLSTDVFRGGTFELRNRWTLVPLAQANNTGFGDAILFRISEDLEHRVTEVVDKVAKTACAGFFRASGLNYFTELSGQFASAAMAGHAEVSVAKASTAHGTSLGSGTLPDAATRDRRSRSR